MKTAVSQPVARKANGHGVTPVVPVGKLRRRPAMVVGFLLILALGASLGVVVLTTFTTSSEVVAARASVERGQVITAEDLMVVRVSTDPGLQVIPASELASLVGKRASTDLSAGSLVGAGQVSDGVVPRTGESVVGLALGRGTLPAEPLKAADRVRVVLLPEAAQAASGGAAVSTPVDAAVLNVAESDDGQTVAVDVVVSAGRAAEVATAAAAGRVALVLDSRER